MTKSSLIVFLGAAFAFALQPKLAFGAEDLAIIVNKTSSVIGINSNDLRSVLLGDKEKWPDGKKAVSALLPSDRPETRFVLKAICSMSEADFKRYFMQLTFQGKTFVTPHILASPSAIKNFVASTPGALGVIPSASLDSTVSMIPLDGNAPGTPGYKLSVSH